MKEIHCQEPWFSKIRDGIKKIEGRKYSPKYATMQLGEILKFYCEDENFLTKVIKVVKYDSLEGYLYGEGVQNALPGVESFEQAVEIYRGFNSREKLNAAGGFLALHVQVIK